MDDEVWGETAVTRTEVEPEEPTHDPSAKRANFPKLRTRGDLLKIEKDIYFVHMYNVLILVIPFYLKNFRLEF